MTTRPLSLLLMAALAVLLAGGGVASAEVQVEGKPDAVHLEARAAPLHDVLAALHERFNLSYRSNDALEAQTTGIYDGPLPRILARILDGYDYVMRIAPDGADLLVLRQHQSGAPAAAAIATHLMRPPLTAAERRHYERGHLR